MTSAQSKMSGSLYDEGYWERGQGSNYVNYGDDPGWAATAATLRRFLKPESVLYELASAKGYFLYWARRNGFEAYGVDISPYAVANAHPEVREYLTLGNAVHTSWSDQTADCVCSWEFMEHVPEDELDDLFAEMERLAKPDALFVHRIGTLESESDLSSHLHDHSHVTNYPATWWREKFTERGYVRHSDVEDVLNETFAGRDWCNRFFVYGREAV